MERRARRGQRSAQANGAAKIRKDSTRSRFAALMEEGDLSDDFAGESSKFGAGSVYSNEKRDLVGQESRDIFKKILLKKKEIMG